MSDLLNVVNALGRDELRRRLGVGRTAISNAIAAGCFPPAWHSVMVDLGKETGVNVPYEMFSWRSPPDKMNGVQL